jgi:hypothetical protein
MGIADYNFVADFKDMEKVVSNKKGRISGS